MIRPRRVMLGGAVAFAFGLAIAGDCHEPPAVGAWQLPVPLNATAGVPVVAATPPQAREADGGGAPTALRLRASPIDAASDPTWHALPRGTKDLVGRLLQTQHCDPTQLYRSVQWNPRDVWLSPTARVEIANLANQAGATIERLRAATADIRDREFAKLHAESRALPADLTTLQGQANLALVGAAPVFAEIAGQPFVASLAQLPETAGAHQALRQAAMDLVERLAAEFATRGTLDREELAALRGLVH